MAAAQSAPSSGQDLTSQVAKHYNSLEEAGLAERTKSRIFYLRNFNNWIKSMVISEYLTKLRSELGADTKLNVLDLCSGKGGDLLKWKKGGISELVCADIAEMSVIQCTKRYREMQDRHRSERSPSQLFKAQFVPADCTKKRLKETLRNEDMKYDLTSCQFSFHYSFESYHQADMMLRNACESLKVGGYFIGTTPNCHELLKRLRASDDMSFGNDVYRVTFKTEDKENIPLFGAQYDFHLEGVVDCPEFLVYFPALEKMAEKYGMKLVKRQAFADFFKENVSQDEGRGLIGRMQGLEPYPAERGVELLGDTDTDYGQTQKILEDLTAQSESGDSRRKPIKLGTLSQAEWEATTIYLVYAFQKVSDVAPPYDASVHSKTSSGTPAVQPTAASSVTQSQSVTQSVTQLPSVTQPSVLTESESPSSHVTSVTESSPPHISSSKAPQPSAESPDRKRSIPEHDDESHTKTPKIDSENSG